MSGGIKPRAVNRRDRNASLAVREQVRAQKGEDPSSILVFLCCGLSRSGDAGHGVVLGRQAEQPQHDMPQITRSSTPVGSIGIQEQFWNCFSLSPIDPRTECATTLPRKLIGRYSPSTSIGGVGFDCFDWKNVLLLLLSGWYDTNNNRVELTLLPTSCTHTKTDVSNRGGVS